MGGHIVKVLPLGLLVAGVLGDKDVGDVGGDVAALQPTVLGAADPVGHQVEGAELGQPAADVGRPGDRAALFPQGVHIGAVEVRPRVGQPQLGEELVEALGLEFLLADLPPLKLLPQPAVDDLIARPNGLCQGHLPPRKGGLQGDLLGPVEIQQGVVGIQQDKTVF